MRTSHFEKLAHRLLDLGLLGEDDLLGKGDLPGTPQLPALARGEVVLERFEVEEPIGRGGMGEVYRARDRRVDRPIALKVLAPRAGTAGAERGELARWRKEILALRDLKHEGIPVLFDAGSHRGRFVIAMEYVQGTPLDRLVGKSALSREECVRVVASAAWIVDHAHARGVVHRDLKPGNLILGADGGLRVVDFGIAKLEDGSASLTAPNACLGTPGYMSPEQVRSARDVDGRADVFSLGAVLYALLAGRPPFLGENFLQFAEAITSDRPALPLEQLAPDVPRDLAAVVARAIDKDRDRRFPDAASLARALEATLATGAAPPRGPVLVVASAVAALTLAVGGGVALLVARGPAPPPAEPASAASSPSPASPSPATPSPATPSPLAPSPVAPAPLPSSPVLASPPSAPAEAGALDLAAAAIDAWDAARPVTPDGSLDTQALEAARERLANPASPELEARRQLLRATAAGALDRWKEALSTLDAAISSAGPSPSPSLLLARAIARWKRLAPERERGKHRDRSVTHRPILADLDRVSAPGTDEAGLAAWFRDLAAVRVPVVELEAKIPSLPERLRATARLLAAEAALTSFDTRATERFAALNAARPRQPWTLALESIARLEAGEAARARSLARQAFALDPGSPAAAMALYRSYEPDRARFVSSGGRERLRMCEDLLAELRRAARANPGDPHVGTIAAQAAVDLLGAGCDAGTPDAALARSVGRAAATEDDPGFARVLFASSFARYVVWLVASPATRAEAATAAEEELRALADEDPGCGFGPLFQGDLLLGRGAREEARASWRRAVEADATLAPHVAAREAKLK